jgi:alpha-D-ribose 1-methylphosphonate 5-triphosphate synthase subunit PhnG
MSGRWLVGVALAAVLLIPAFARAHEGHAHKVMGTISSIEGFDWKVKTTDGKTVKVLVNGKTTLTRGKVKLTTAAVKVGDRVVVEGTEAKATITAKTIQLGEVVPAKK